MEGCKWCNDSNTIPNGECNKCLRAKNNMTDKEFVTYIVQLARITIFSGFLEEYSKKTKVLK